VPLQDLRFGWLVRLATVAGSLFAIGAGGAAGGQADFSRPRPKGKPNAPSLRSTTSLVMVPVHVRGRTDAPVRGLAKEAFHVYVDDVEQEIRTFAEEEGPISAGIVFDASRSMEGRMQKAREAVERLFDTQMSGDEYMAVAFHSNPELVCAMTPDANRVRSRLSTLRAGGWTSLYDGIFLSAGLMKQATNARRVLVILSDGDDNYSRYTSAEVRRYLREAGVTVFAIGLSGDGFAGLRGRALRSLTEETGGWFRAISNIDELNQAVGELSRGVRSHYVISISHRPSAAGGEKYRKIRVSLDTPGRKFMNVTARSGYYE